MLRVALVQAKPGMVLAAPVLHPAAPERVLLRAGYELDDAAVRRLRDLRLGDLWIRYPGLEFIERHISPEVFRARGIVAAVVRDVVDRFQRDGAARLDYDRYRSAIQDFIRTLESHRTAGLMVQNMVEGDRPLMRHCADVCYLALLMGLKLETYLMLKRERLPGHRAKVVVSLGLAALLHDVGMLALEPDALERFEQKPLDESDKDWRRHVLIGYERMRDGLGPAAAAAVLHHHQHWDGSGFPLKRNEAGEHLALAGEQIHVFARVLTVADLFDRLRRPPGQAATTPAVVALRAMLREPIVSWVDPVVLRALLAVAPAYGPGSQVALSTGDRGVVVDWSPADPCRPTVQILRPADQDRHALRYRDEQEPRRIDLRLRRDIEVVEVDGQNVRGANFYPETPTEYDLAAALIHAERHDAPSDISPARDAA